MKSPTTLIASRSLGHRAPLLWLGLPYLAGLGLAHSGLGATPVVLVGILSLALVLAALSLAATWRRPRLWGAPLTASMLLAGFASYSQRYPRLPDWEHRPAREARLSLRLDRVFPATALDRTSGLALIVETDRHLRELVGQRVYFSLILRKGQAPPTRSAVVRITGLLSPVPGRPAAGSFAASLADLGLHFELTRCHLVGIEQAASPYRQFCERLAARMNTLLGVGLEARSEVSSVYRAMMLGRKQDLAASQRGLFLRSGTMHLFAINGLHIGVVALSLHALLALARCPRPLASTLVLAVLWLDVDTTGESPSAVRAFLMVAVLEAAFILRRPGNPLAALAAALLAFLLLDPADAFGASFRMSYGVVATILTLGVPLATWLPARFPAHRRQPEVTWNRRQRFRAALQRHVLGGLGVGAAATLVSAVTGIEFFGLFTPGGLLANLVLAPLAMLVIVAGFLSLGAGLSGAAAVGRFCNGAASLLLRSIASLIHLGLRLPGACFAAHFRADWIGPASLTALLAVCLAGYAYGWSRQTGGWWPPFVLVALTLVFGVKFGVTVPS